MDYRGPAFEIIGPLQVPTSPQLWPPVLVWGAVPGVADQAVSSAPRPAGRRS